MTRRRIVHFCLGELSRKHISNRRDRADFPVVRLLVGDCNLKLEEAQAATQDTAPSSSLHAIPSGLIVFGGALQPAEPLLLISAHLDDFNVYDLQACSWRFSIDREGQTVEGCVPSRLQSLRDRRFLYMVHLAVHAFGKHCACVRYSI